jgi:hypothetical protein
MYSFVINTCNALIKGLGVVLTVILSLLPNSPFQAFITSDSSVMTVLKYINYFIPVLTFIAIMEAYIVAVALFNIVQIVARWVKLIE